MARERKIFSKKTIVKVSAKSGSPSFYGITDKAERISIRDEAAKVLRRKILYEKFSDYEVYKQVISIGWGGIGHGLVGKVRCVTIIPGRSVAIRETYTSIYPESTVRIVGKDKLVKALEKFGMTVANGMGSKGKR